MTLHRSLSLMSPLAAPSSGRPAQSSKLTAPRGTGPPTQTKRQKSASFMISATLLGKLRIEDQRLQFLLLHRVADRTGGKPVIQAGGHGPELLAGEKADGELGAVVEKQSDAIAFSDAELDQEIGKLVHAGVQVA